MAQLVQVAEREQALPHLLADILMSAGTDFDFAKVRMPERHIPAQESKTTAEWAVRIAREAFISGPFILSA